MLAFMLLCILAAGWGVYLTINVVLPQVIGLFHRFYAGLSSLDARSFEFWDAFAFGFSFLVGLTTTTYRRVIHLFRR